MYIADVDFITHFTRHQYFDIYRLRRKGERFLHSKHVLLIIVALNVIDCVLVLGELILDIHYVVGKCFLLL